MSFSLTPPTPSFGTPPAGPSSPIKELPKPGKRPAGADNRSTKRIKRSSAAIGGSLKQSLGLQAHTEKDALEKLQWKVLSCDGACNDPSKKTNNFRYFKNVTPVPSSVFSGSSKPDFMDMGAIMFEYRATLDSSALKESCQKNIREAKAYQGKQNSIEISESKIHSKFNEFSNEFISSLFGKAKNAIESDNSVPVRSSTNNEGLYPVATAEKTGSSKGRTKGHIEDKALVGTLSDTLDRVALDNPPSWVGAHISAVFDGHGGHNCSTYAQQNAIASIQKRLKEFAPHEEILSEEYQDLVIANAVRTGLVDLGRSFSVSQQGSTANFALATNRHLWIFNIGDSAAILIRKEGAGQLLNTLPRPEDLKEGVEKRGGKLKSSGGALRLGGILTPRSLGDQYIPGMSCRAKISRLPLPQEGDILVQCSDGVSDVALVSQITSFVNECRNKKLSNKEIAAALVDVSAKTWDATHQRRDDILVHITQF